MGEEPAALQIRLGPDNEDATVARIRFQRDHIRDVDLMKYSVGDG
jgi:hypothetical protein